MRPLSDLCVIINKPRGLMDDQDFGKMWGGVQKTE